MGRTNSNMFSAQFIAGLLQLAASVSWIISVCIYNSWETGDIFQMLAACCWTVSNLLVLSDTPEDFTRKKEDEAAAAQPPQIETPLESVEVKVEKDGDDGSQVPQTGPTTAEKRAGCAGC